MSLPAISIRNPVFAWMLMLGFILFGIIAIFKLGVGQYPDVDVPVVEIRAELEGAAPEIVESEIVDILEDTVMAVEGVRDVISQAEQGRAGITVYFDINRDIDLAVQDIQARVSAAMRNLPTDLDAPVIRKTNPEENPIMWVALMGPRSPQELSDLTRNVLRDQFLTVPGNGDVRMGGYLERNVRIWVDPNKLNAQGMTVQEVIDAVQRQHAEQPAGRIEGPYREANVRVEGEALDLEQWRNLVIREHEGASVMLRDVALIEDGFEDKRRISYIDGVPAQGMGIIKQHGANAVDLAQRVRERVDELNRTVLPEDLELSIRFDSSKFIEAAIHETEETLLYAVLLTALVCWLFLGALSPTFNVVLAIPVSVLGTFAVMHFAGFTLNTFTLLALSLSIGIVVDDAVMVLENIYRHGEMGKDRVSASRDGATQISFAAFATTLAIVAIFLPVAFMEGIIGKFFFEFGVVLSVAVMISLIEALTLTPARCSQWLNVKEKRNLLERTTHWAFTRLEGWYERLLNVALRWRGCVMILAVVIFAASLTPLSKMVLGETVPGVPQLNAEMVPAQDQGFVMLAVKTPVGSSIDYTDHVMRQIQERLDHIKEIESSYLIVGGFGGVGNEGRGFLSLTPREERTLSQEALIHKLRKELDVFPGTQVRLIDRSREGLPGVRGNRDPISFTIRGPDFQKLGELSQTFERAMRDSGKMVDINSDFEVGMPEIHVRPNREKALAHDVDVETVSRAISALVGGTRIAKFTRDGRRYDVRLRLLREDRLRPEDIGSLYVRNNKGVLIRLAEVVDVGTRPSLMSITRQNRERAVTLACSPAAGVAQADAIGAVDVLSKDLLPDGYKIVYSGQAETFREAKYNLLFAFLFGIPIAYMVLASQFNSFLQPVAILLTLPFSISGGLLALLLTGQTLNIYSGIGFILLAGIVKKNGILLVDFTNQTRAEGHSIGEALRIACPMRLRAILMTSTATIAGALPGALAGGAGAELRIPMAVTVIGGMIVSTLLTLFVVPCFYSLLENSKEALFPSTATDAVAPAGEPATAPGD